MREETIVEQMRRTKQRLAAKFNYDINAIVADIKSRKTSTKKMAPNKALHLTGSARR